MKKYVLVSMVFLMLFPALSSASLGARVTYLPIPLPMEFLPQDMNNRGQIVGDCDGTVAIWQNGKLHKLAISGIANAFVLNDSGTIILRISNEKRTSNGIFAYRNGEVQQLWSEHIDAYVSGINNQNQIAGCYNADTGGLHAFFWDDEMMQSIDRLSIFSDINERGEAVGTIYDGWTPHAFCWRNGRIAFVEKNPSMIFSINNRGEAVGTIGFDPAKWIRGMAYPLRTFGEGGHAIDNNDKGLIVGWLFSGGKSQVVIWYNNQIIDLERTIQMPFKIGMVFAINNQDQILCWGGPRSSNQEGYYLLQPRCWR